MRLALGLSIASPTRGGGAGADSTLALDLNFAGYGSFLDSVSGSSSLVTFTRATTATYFDSAGVLQTAAIDAARFDYNPLTLALNGLLLEEARTNVVRWNRDMTNVAWTKTNITPLKDQTGIDGSANSASSLTATAGNGTCLQAITLASSARGQSSYVKRLVGAGTVEMTTDNGATWTAVTVTSSWTRVTIPAQTLANPTVGFRIVTSGDSIAVDFVQNETVVSAVIATSAIATTTVPVTRAIDSAILSGANFSSWHNATEGTWLLDFIPATAVAGQLLVASNGAASERNILQGNGATIIVDGGGTNFNSTAAAPTAGALNKMALAYKLNNSAGAVNGAATATDVTCTMASPDRLRLANGAAGNEQPPAMWCSRVRYYNVRKTNVEIQALTT
jgi:hypothetical protein